MALSFNVPDSVLSTTLANYRPTLEDNIFKANPLLYWLAGQYPAVPNAQNQSRGQKKTLPGGESIVIPLMYEQNTTVTNYSKYSPIDVTPQEGITSARFTWKQMAASISISGLEEAQNAESDTRIINLLEAKTKQAEMSLGEQMDSQFFGAGGDGTLAFTGLQSIVSTTGTLGGISRTGNPWWQAKVATSAGSFAAGGLAAMRTKFNDVSKGPDHPDLIMTDQTTFERYENILQPQERFTDSKTADGGFQNLKFKDAVVMYDFYCTAGSMYFLNSKYLNWNVHKDVDFATTAFVKPDNQDARVAQILVYGDLTVSNCQRQGLISGFTA